MGSKGQPLPGTWKGSFFWPAFWGVGRGGVEVDGTNWLVGLTGLVSTGCGDSAGWGSGLGMGPAGEISREGGGSADGGGKVAAWQD